jgi:hypothetical protein
MTVAVDKAGRDDQASGVNASCVAIAAHWRSARHRNRDDAIAGNTDIRRKRRAARAVDDATIPDDQVESSDWERLGR